MQTFSSGKSGIIQDLEGRTEITVAGICLTFEMNIIISNRNSAIRLQKIFIVAL